MSEITLEAESRTMQGKGASRRLRRLEGKIPAIIYGGTKDPVLLNLLHNKVIKALEDEAIYSSIITVKVGSNKEQVLLKDIQRHPYKSEVIHMDFQRVTANDVLVRMVPLHFTNGEKCPGHVAGGVINHFMNQLEVTCKAKDLPEFIEIDLSKMEMDDVLHLSNLVLPKNVSLTVDVADKDHDLPVVGIHISKSALAEEAQEAEEELHASEEIAAEDADEEAADSEEDDIKE
jgi:large subunit ribosomal protein L25